MSHRSKKSLVQDVQNWHREVKLSDKYGEYREELTDMLSEIQTMWDGHLSQMNVGNDRMELLHDNIQPARSALYHVGPKTRELERAKIDKKSNRKS